MKKLASLLLAILMLFSLFPTAFAVDNSMNFQFVLSCGEKSSVSVPKGEEVTVTFTLKRNASGTSAGYAMYAMQNEIVYDSDFFELVEGSVMTRDDVEWTDIGLVGSTDRALYMNTISETGGTRWGGSQMVGSFRLKVKASSGTSDISCENYLVSTQDGMDTFASSCKNLSVTVKAGGSDDSGDDETLSYKVSFRSNGGSSVAAQTVEAGALVTKPNDPIRNGYTFMGWYKNSGLTLEWDFEKDTVSADTTLYAKWQRNGSGTTGGTGGTGSIGTTGGTGSGSTLKPSPSPGVSPSPSPTVKPSSNGAADNKDKDSQKDKTDNVLSGIGGDTVNVIDEERGKGFPWWLIVLLCLLALLVIIIIILLATRKTVSFVALGAEEISAQKVRSGGKVKRPQEPKKAGAVFAGWFKDELRTQRWDFEEDRVEEDMSLYAKWL